jgi:hypothetical protein
MSVVGMYSTDSFDILSFNYFSTYVVFLHHDAVRFHRFVECILPRFPLGSRWFYGFAGGNTRVGER